MTDPYSIGNTVGLAALGIYAAWNSRKAKKLSEPTGNGFAAKVVQSLARIELTQKSHHKQLGRIETKTDKLNDQLVDHLQDHAGNDIRRRSA